MTFLTPCSQTASISVLLPEQETKYSKVVHVLIKYHKTNMEAWESGATASEILNLITSLTSWYP